MMTWRRGGSRNMTWWQGGGGGSGYPPKMMTSFMNSPLRTHYWEKTNEIMYGFQAMFMAFLQCLWFSYNFYGFQAIWLTLKQDPRAGKARATLDREVNCQYYLLGKHKRDLIGEQSWALSRSTALLPRHDLPQVCGPRLLRLFVEPGQPDLRQWYCLG